MLTQLKRRPSVVAGDLVPLLLECHERIRCFVALAEGIATRTEARAAQVVQACASVERYFTEALPLHVTDEEQSLAPRLRGRSTEVDRALASMEHQHAAHERRLADLLFAVRAVRQEPQHEALRSELARATQLLGDDFREHLELEESIIFPAARKLLSVELRASILLELRQRRMRVT